MNAHSWHITRDHTWLLSPCYSSVNLHNNCYAWGRERYPLDRWRNRGSKRWSGYHSFLLKGRAGTQCQMITQCRYAIHCPPLPLGSFCAGMPHQSIDITHQLKLHCFPGCLLQLRYWPCRAWQAPRTCSGWGGGVQRPSPPRECPAARGLSLLSQVNFGNLNP